MPVTVNKREARQLLQLTLEGGADEVKTRRKPRNLEAQHQALLFAWRKEMQEKYPQLRFLFSTLNGLFIPPHLLARAVEAGMSRGVLDLFLPLRRVESDGSIWSGLAMDLKTPGKGRPTPEQLEWARHLIENGWRVYFPEGALESWRILCCFLGISGSDHWAADLKRREEVIRLTAG